VLFRFLHQTRLDGIHPDVFDVLCIFIGVSDPVLVVTLLPNFMINVLLLRCAVRESSLDELHCFLERYQGSRRKDQVNVISHEDELVYLKPPFSPILANYIQQETAQTFGLQYESSLRSRERSEESTRFLRCEKHNETEVNMIRRRRRPGGSPRIYAGDGVL
jgi:hypothetical protein